MWNVVDSRVHMVWTTWGQTQITLPLPLEGAIFNQFLLWMEMVAACRRSGVFGRVE